MKRTFREGPQPEALDADEFTTSLRRSFSERRANLTWEQILQFRRVLLVAAAGAGTTYECEQRAKLMFDHGDAAFYLRLENLPTHGIVGLMRKKQKQRFKAIEVREGVRGAGGLGLTNNQV